MKKNNLFKISLLLLVLNFSNIYSDEFSACVDGQRLRDGANGIALLTSNSNNGCTSLYTTNKREQAACIFGFNSNIAPVISTQYSLTTQAITNADGSITPSTTTIATKYSQGYASGNGCDTSLAGCGKGCNQFNPGDPRYNYCGGGQGTCDYGASIGWALDDAKSSINNLYFFTNSFPYNNTLLNTTIWGNVYTQYSPGAWSQPNVLKDIYDSYTGVCYPAIQPCTGLTNSTLNGI